MKNFFILSTIIFLGYSLDFVETCTASERTADKEELYLVVGSIRENPDSTPYIRRYWDTPQTDSLHIHTYGGKAVTIDVKDCKNKCGKHIIGDARHYDFMSFDIKAAYLEMLPTLDFPATNNFEYNYLGDIVKNISTAMSPGATMEIEWFPYSTLMNGPLVSDIENLISKNPFQGFQEINVILNATSMAIHNYKFMQGLPDDMNQKVMQYNEKIKQILFFMEQNNLGTLTQIKTRLYREIEILKVLLNDDSLAISMDVSPLADFDEFASDDNEIFFFAKGVPLSLPSKYVYPNAMSFYMESLLGFLVSDLSVLNNSPFVIKYVQDIGYKDVTIERTQSPHNHRKNVWIIKGVRI